MTFTNYALKAPVYCFKFYLQVKERIMGRVDRRVLLVPQVPQVSQANLEFMDNLVSQVLQVLRVLRVLQVL